MDTAARDRLGLLILGLALALGVIGDGLLRAPAWGINLPLFLLSLTAAAVLISRFKVLPVSGSLGWIAAMVLLLGSMFAFRASPELQVVNAMAALLLMGVAMLRARGGSLKSASLTDYTFKALGYLVLPIVDFGNLIGFDIHWKNFGGNAGARKVGAVARGLLIAAPILLIFGALFVSADASFEHAVNNLFRFDIETATSDMVGFAVCAWLAGGLLRRIFVAPAPVAPLRPMQLGPDGHTMIPGQPKEPPRLGITEVAIVLGGLNLLFGAFVAMQFRHFFGSAQWIHDTNGVTFSNFARRGFFELVTVAALAVPTLIGFHSLLNKDNPKHETAFRALSWTLIGLIFIVIDSAVDKMRLYVEAYGMTTPRLYVCASLAWISLLIVWFGLTALRGKTDRFAWGGVVSLVACVLTLNLINPDAIVARVNTTRPDSAKVDWGYLATLSDDAVPTLVAALDRVPAAHRGQIASALQHRQNSQSGDWRGWNFGSAAAMRSISSASGAIQAALPPATAESAVTPPPNIAE